MLDLKRIDLTQVSLRGVDFTGCDFTGVNIYELDLSECIISPAQIEQAIGHKPTALELQKILAPKKNNKKKKGRGIDFTKFFDGCGSLNWDATKGGTDINTMFKAGKEFLKSFSKGDDKKEKFNEKHSKSNDDERENNTDELRKSIEKHKQEVLNKMKKEKEENSEVKSANYTKSDRGLER